MSGSTFEIVPATAALARAFFGEAAPFSFDGHVALLDGRPVGIGGISYVGGLPIAFTDMKPELRERPVERRACYRFLKREFAKWRAPLFAVCQTGEPTAPRVLARLGFVPTGEDRGSGPLMARGL